MVIFINLVLLVFYLVLVYLFVVLLLGLLGLDFIVVLFFGFICWSCYGIIFILYNCFWYVLKMFKVIVYFFGDYFFIMIGLECLRFFEFVFEV